MENWNLSWSKLLELKTESVNELSDGLIGVYRLSREEGDKRIVFYVGDSEDLKKDLLNLLSENSSSECVKATITSYKCYFRYSLIKEQEVRNAAVRKMFKVYQPTCNSEEPPSGDEIEVNIN